MPVPVGARLPQFRVIPVVHHHTNTGKDPQMPACSMAAHVQQYKDDLDEVDMTDFVDTDDCRSDRQDIVVKTREPAAHRHALRDLLEACVAAAFAIDPHALRLPTRGRARIAFARQVAMYLAHVAGGLTLTEVGQMFNRDRTTVAHACNVVENRRDSDPFDKGLERLENVIRGISQRQEGRGGLRR